MAVSMQGLNADMQELRAGMNVANQELNNQPNHQNLSVSFYFYFSKPKI